MPEAVYDVEGRAGRGDAPERKPPQLQAEQDDQEQAEPEGRRGQEREGRARHRVVVDGILLQRGRHADREREHQHDDEDRTR